MNQLAGGKVHLESARLLLRNFRIRGAGLTHKRNPEIPYAIALGGAGRLKRPTPHSGAGVAMSAPLGIV